MDEDFKTRVSDYFDAFDLVDLLNIPTTDIVNNFEDLILDNQEMLEDYMRNGR